MNDTDANAVFAPIWRRKWLILAVALLVGVASYFYYKHQRPTYQAATQVFLGAGAEEQVPGEKGGGKGRSSSFSDQAALINTIVVEQVRRRLKAEHKNAAARTGKIKAKLPEKSEFVTITTEAHSAKNAALLANLTARIYIARLQRGHRQAVEKALAIARRQLHRIEQAAFEKAVQAARTPTKQGSGSSAPNSAATGGQSASSVIQEANLQSKIGELEASLETASAEQVKPARPAGATLLSPKPRKDAIFGFVIGLVLAAIAAYAFSRFDRRLRSIAAIEAATGLPLLAGIPKVRQPVVRGAGQSPRPSVHLLEPLRRLQTALRLTNGAVGATAVAEAPTFAEIPRVILFVSPDPGDGKSTIVADLALVERDAGQRVVIVEANFRRPVQNRLLGIDGEGKLAAVLTGRLDAEEAVQRVTPALSQELASAPDEIGGAATAVQAHVGSLFVLGGDRSVPNPPALLGQESAAALLRSLAERFDQVLIDAPSPLEVSDVMPLLGVVDRIVVVARAGHSRETSARRLQQLLLSAPCAPVAGVVANALAPAELKRYGFSAVRGSIWPGSRRTGR